jgi:deoxyhypusine synthase
MKEHFLPFNAATIVDAAMAYEKHRAEGGLMMITLVGAMSTPELGKSLAEMIRKNKVHIISCAGANLEEDVMNLISHTHYKRIPNYRNLSPQQEWKPLQEGLNRVTDTCIRQEETFRRLQKHLFKI